MSRSSCRSSRRCCRSSRRCCHRSRRCCPRNVVINKRRSNRGIAAILALLFLGL